MTEQKTPRRRGRPKGGSDSRERIIAAAVDEFGEQGYDGSTIRSIAARAGVDSALVHHYFGTKADLFAEAVGIPLRPDIDVPAIVAGPRDEVGERLVRYVLEAFEQPEVRRRGVMLLRTALGSRLTTPLLAGFLTRELIGRIARSLGTEDADLRASLVASQIAGMLIARYLLRLPALAAASVDELVGRVGPTVQRYLFD
ncbi:MULTISPECIES: TetR family transcriptional regulator [unclassified Microbacterium]|uniref:TetR/AcrR family transcriptional regulator n=1 Tax=unclassified Microbacterium TaxID=2609290 RepID=UPI0016051D9F|nr:MULTISPECIES: TetR family transcriptional regulator [unclassified Microbacterium]QNA91862.1 TetR/AcrR family transcriptional regulator [Microbacterium sp. Se63.02b]QYM65083.1 TetR family transcriptional regulator [Microbacterium sp. Se5.02b]